MSTNPPAPSGPPTSSPEPNITYITASVSAALCGAAAVAFAIFLGGPAYAAGAFTGGGIIGCVAGVCAFGVAVSPNPEATPSAVAYAVLRAFVDWAIRLLLLAWPLVWAKTALPLYFKAV